MSTIGIKIKEYDSIAKCISILRQYSKASMGEIKSAVEENRYVLICDYTDHSGIRRVRKCYDALTKIGIKVDIYEHDRLTDRDFISNLIETYSEIEQEVLEQIETEVAAEDEG